VGEPAFYITSDYAEDPAFARHIARTWGYRNLEAMTSWSRDPGDRESLVFPDDSVLLMIGETQQLVDACKEARDSAFIKTIATSTHAALKVHYVRMWISRIPYEVNTLITIGAAGRLPDTSRDGWHGVVLSQGCNRVSTWDIGNPDELPGMIRTIKRDDGGAWKEKRDF
jgi:hypothetical protein